ncbi:hypothetical protein G6F42_021060 [Rhizopus arrhizus]|nr:hypothetical protein G6F42_021060 [Rhizopus arrhizus]
MSITTVITGLSVLFLSYKRYGSKYATFTEIESITASLQKRKIALILLTGIQTAHWLYQFIQYALASHHHNLTNSLSLVSLFITWLTLFVLSVASPRLNHYKERAYNYVFTFLFCYLSLDSVYRLLADDSVQTGSLIYSAVSFALFAIAGTTKQPYHPRDLQAASYENLEIKDGTVYRNNLVLSPEATASIFSWAAFQW